MACATGSSARLRAGSGPGFYDEAVNGLCDQIRADAVVGLPQASTKRPSNGLCDIRACRPAVMSWSLLRRGCQTACATPASSTRRRPSPCFYEEAVKRPVRPRRTSPRWSGSLTCFYEEAVKRPVRLHLQRDARVRVRASTKRPSNGLCDLERAEDLARQSGASTKRPSNGLCDAGCALATLLDLLDRFYEEAVKRPVRHQASWPTPNELSKLLRRGRQTACATIRSGGRAQRVLDASTKRPSNGLCDEGRSPTRCR